MHAPLWRNTHSEVKMYETSDVEKMSSSNQSVCEQVSTLVSALVSQSGRELVSSSISQVSESVSS